MRFLDDTSPEARRVLTEGFRRMPPERKWQLLDQGFRHAREIHALGYRSRHPNATVAEVRADWMARVLGIHQPPWDEEAVAVDHQPIEQQLVVRTVVRAFRQLGIACAVGGSLASSYYGEIRQTHDADLSAEPFPNQAAALVASLGKDYYVALPAVVEAIRHRSSFNVIHTPTMFKVDVFIRKDRPFDHSLLQRRIPTIFQNDPGEAIDLVTPEDIILLKLEWYRIGGETSDRQWSDVLGVLRTQAGRLDDAYLDRWAAALRIADLLTEARTEAQPGTP